MSFWRMSKKKTVILIALASILSLWYDQGLIISIKDRRLSLNKGNGECEWVAAIQYTDPGFPTEQDFKKTIIAGYPGGDKRITFIQLEGLTGLSARDEWEFAFLGMTNQPFIKANYPHHEGIWGWQDQADQVVLVVSNIKKAMIEYHDILWDIGYAQTFEEAYERMDNLYKDEVAGVPHENPPVEDFLVWRDLRIFDEIHWYSWFTDYYMEGGLMRDMFTHEVTTVTQWKLATLPNFFTKFEMRYGRFVDEGEVVDPNIDPMCATLSEGCYPVLVIDPLALVDPEYGPAEARKLAELVNGTKGFEDWMIEEEAWECVWNELITSRKGIKTYLDRDTFDYETYTLSFELKNEMWHELNRLIEKYKDQEDQVAIDLVNILTGHREELGVDTPVDPISYEELMSYHLAFPPFFPNQKMFKSDDDFFVNAHLKYEDLDASNIDSVIDRRRAHFEEEMAAKRERNVDVKYFDAPGWTSLPGAGLSSLTPYASRKTARIKYHSSPGVFATSNKSRDVAALFSSYIHIDRTLKKICITSEGGSKLFLDNVLRVNNDGLHGERRVCADITEGVYKLDLEYFKGSGGKSMLMLEFGVNEDRLRVVPTRSWASADSARKFRQLIIMEERLEEDLRTLKETHFVGQTTRTEFNRRKALSTDPEEERKLGREAKFDFSHFDEILQERKSDQNT
uniref:PA14 domain-containing protein n=1 Tax=Chaetoceros debilis TaxID=122233 RepID=A0A7S3Q3S8_9STRA